MEDKITPELLAALAIVRDKARAMPKTKKADRYTYTPIEEIIDYLREILAEAGLIVVQKVVSEGERPGVETYIYHMGGGYISSRVIAPPSEGGLKMSSIQRAGAEITYLRRYSLAAMLSLVSDADTDGYRIGDGAQGVGQKIAVGQEAADRADRLAYLRDAMAAAGAPQADIDAVTEKTTSYELNALWKKYCK